MSRMLAAILVLAFPVPLTSASTPEAWSAVDQEVLKTCLAATTLRHAQPAGERVDFEDRIGFSLLLIVGRYPQPHMNNRAGWELCLFDKRTRTTLVSEADRLVLKRKPAALSQPP